MFLIKDKKYAGNDGFVAGVSTCDILSTENIFNAMHFENINTAIAFSNYLELEDPYGDYEIYEVCLKEVR